MIGAGGDAGGLEGLTSLMLTASRSHRDKVGCESPVSSDSLVALTALGPSIRRTIRAFTLAVYSIDRLRYRPAQVVGSSGRGGNYADTGGYGWQQTKAHPCRRLTTACSRRLMLADRWTDEWTNES